MPDLLATIKPRRKKFKIKILLFLVSIAILIAIAFYYFKAPKITYTTIKPTIEDISQDVNATGTLSPINTVEVGSQISGTILEVLVDSNDEVKKGQILAKIDPEKLNQSVDNFIAQLKSARAKLYSTEVSLENKKWNYDNYLKLYEKTNGKSPSQIQLKNAELEYKNALADIEIQKANISQLETSLNSAKIDVKNSIIKSPVDGVVLSRNIEPGQTVAANFETPTLFEIAQDLTKMKLISNILEADIGKVKEGQEIEFVVDAYPNETFKSKIAKVNFADSSSANSNSNTSTSSSNIISYEVTTYVDNNNLYLRPGMSATASIKSAYAKDALVIPYQALLYKPITKETKKSSVQLMPIGGPKKQKNTYFDDGNKIWILENGEPKEVEVSIGIKNGRNIQILSDNISTNTEVILHSQSDK